MASLRHTGASRGVRRRLRAAVAALACALALAGAREAAAYPVDREDVPPGAFPFAAFTDELGGETLNPWDLVQEPDGTLWVASDDGVFRHDGLTVEHFGAAQGIASPYVRQIVRDGAGAIYALSVRGVFVFDGAAFHPPPERGGDVGLAAARRLAVDAGGRVWGVTPRGLVRRADDGVFEIDDGFPGRDPESIFVDPRGTMVVGAHGAVYERPAGGAFRAYGAEAGLPSEQIASIARDGRGWTWVSASSELLVADESMRFHRVPGLDRIERFLSLDRSGRLWIGSEAGLFYADDDGHLVEATGLPTHRTVGAFEDAEGGLWAIGIGLFRAAGRGLWRTYTEKQGLPDSTFWSVHRTKDGVLWVGTQLGLARAAGRAWVTVDEVPREPVRSITEDAEGALWLAGPPGRVFRYRPKTHAVEAWGTAEGLPDTRTLALAFDPDGTAWVGSAGAGLYRSEAAGESLRWVEQPLDGTTGAMVRDVLRDTTGRMWFATDRGLFMKHGDVWHRFGADDGLPRTSMSYLAERRSGEICAADVFGGGVACFRASDASLTRTLRLDAATGLASDMIFFLGDDARGRLWVGTNHGADMVDGARVVHFGTTDGIAHADTDARAFWADEGGDVWIGTSHGMSHFYGSRYDGPPAPPSVRLAVKKQLASGAAVRVGDGDAIEHGVRGLDVRFAAATFDPPASIEYQTRMVGLDGAWRRAPSQQVSYAALDPGPYVLEVRARRTGGDWGPPRALPFTVLAPWWQSWWFRGGCAAAATALLAFAVRWRGYALQRRNEALSKLVAGQTRELAEAHEEVARAEKLSALGRMLAQLSHELNNPINVIANNVGPLREYVDTMTKLLAEQRQAAAALPDGGADFDRAWQEADGDFVLSDSVAAIDVVATAARRVQRIQGDLRAFLRNEASPKARGDLNHEVRETVGLVKRSLPEKVTLTCDLAELPELEYDAGRLGQVFLNLLQNAVDAVGDAGTIAVRTYVAGDAVCVEVKDSGPGVAASVRHRIFEPFVTTKPMGKGTGLGLAICRQIVVEHHGGSIEIEDPPGGGAAFVVRLPREPAAKPEEHAAT